MAIGTIRGNRALALAAVSLATFMTSLDNTVVNVALPSIQRDLRLSLGGLEWTASAYVLVFASLLLAGGAGRRGGAGRPDRAGDHLRHVPRREGAQPGGRRLERRHRARGRHRAAG